MRWLWKSTRGKRQEMAAAAREATAGEQALVMIWQEVLKLDRPPGIADDFFDLGGDSLAATHILARIAEQTGKKLSLREFPFTIAQTMTALAEAKTSAVPSAFPHQVVANEESQAVTDGKLGHAEAMAKLRSFVRSWKGVRASDQSLIVGSNVDGTRPPLFWVFQGEREFHQLALHLGEDQPLYAMRSGHLITGLDRDEVEALASAYLREIATLRPRGPLIIGGNCQGGLVAYTIAQQLLRQGREVPLLILMEWVFGPLSYPGHAIWLYGRDSEFANYWLNAMDDELLYLLAFEKAAIETIPGEHGQFFTDTNVRHLAACVTRCLSEATDRLSGSADSPTARVNGVAAAFNGTCRSAANVVSAAEKLLQERPRQPNLVIPAIRRLVEQGEIDAAKIVLSALQNTLRQRGGV